MGDFPTIKSVTNYCNLLFYLSMMKNLETSIIIQEDSKLILMLTFYGEILFIVS